jgi:hypothetical protein
MIEILRYRKVLETLALGVHVAKRIVDFVDAPVI